ncbi:MAG: NUDIX domain-containing protein [Parcubacteria group bacterium]|jgi:ADP-ribose pyrophosphatase
MEMKKIKPREGLPVNAKCVFKGVIFEVWQWEQKMFDGTTETFEKIWRYPTLEIIATVGDKIIIENQDQPDSKGNINLVSGRADKGDDILEEAKRELLEETGCQSDNWNLFMKHKISAKILHDICYFVARDCKKIQEPNLDAGEKIETKLVTFDEFLLLTEEPNFWVAPQFVNLMLRARFDEKKKEELRRIIFGG